MAKRVPDEEIVRAISEHAGNVKEAALSVGMPRGHFYERLADLGIGRSQLSELRGHGTRDMSGVPVPKLESVPWREGKAGPIFPAMSAMPQTMPAKVALGTLKVTLPPDLHLLFEEAHIKLLMKGYRTDKESLLVAFLREMARVIFPEYVHSILPIEAMLPEEEDK